MSLTGQMTLSNKHSVDMETIGTLKMRPSNQDVWAVYKKYDKNRNQELSKEEIKLFRNDIKKYAKDNILDDKEITIFAKKLGVATNLLKKSIQMLGFEILYERSHTMGEGQKYDLLNLANEKSLKNTTDLQGDGIIGNHKSIIIDKKYTKVLQALEELLQNKNYKKRIQSHYLKINGCFQADFQTEHVNGRAKYLNNKRVTADEKSLSDGYRNGKKVFSGITQQTSIGDADTSFILYTIIEEIKNRNTKKNSFFERKNKIDINNKEAIKKLILTMYN